jgi:hypothetical protein
VSPCTCSVFTVLDGQSFVSCFGVRQSWMRSRFLDPLPSALLSAIVFERSVEVQRCA